MKTCTLYVTLLCLVAAPTAQADAKAPPSPVVREVTVNAPPARVWQAWTTTAGVKTFFAPVDWKKLQERLRRARGPGGIWC